MAASKPKAKESSDGLKTASDQPILNSYLHKEVARLAKAYSIDVTVFQDFAYFVIEHHKKKDPKIKPLTLSQIKEAVYRYFSVTSTAELKKSGAYKMATDGMDRINLSAKEGWERLYRKFVGILPGEENQQGYGCINGINIFNYFRPWQVFGLDPKTATLEAIRDAYRKLSKIYHPDVKDTGDAKVFEQLTIMYKSITAKG